jgi:hypothetical protein
MDERRTANFWLLITALNAAKFAIVELNPSEMKGDSKHQFLFLRNAIVGFFTTMQKRSSQADKELLSAMSFENVAAMTETMSMIAQIPEPQIEWFLSQANLLVYAAINKELEKNT